MFCLEEVARGPLRHVTANSHRIGNLCLKSQSNKNRRYKQDVAAHDGAVHSPRLKPFPFISAFLFPFLLSLDRTFTLSYLVSFGMGWAGRNTQGVSEKLGTLIEGESLLNDGSAIVVFEVFLGKL